MPLSMSEASVPAITQMLTALSAILDKAAAHRRGARHRPRRTHRARLAPDMLPLKRQVTIASDHAKGIVARLSGREIPKFEDTEIDVRRVEGAARQNARLRQKRAGSGDRRVGDARDFAAAQEWPDARLHGSELSDPVRSAELLFPRRQRHTTSCVTRAWRSASATSWARSPSAESPDVAGALRRLSHRNGRHHRRAWADGDSDHREQPLARNARRAPQRRGDTARHRAHDRARRCRARLAHRGARLVVRGRPAHRRRLSRLSRREASARNRSARSSGHRARAARRLLPAGLSRRHSAIRRRLSSSAPSSRNSSTRTATMRCRS